MRPLTCSSIFSEIYRYNSLLSAKVDNDVYQEQLKQFSLQTGYLATSAKSIKDMLSDIDRFHDSSTNEEQAFYKNLRYQILKTILAFHEAKKGDPKAISELKSTYKKIAESYKNSMKIIEDMAKNREIKSEITAIAINDMHLVKSFSKSLRNTLNSTGSKTDLKVQNHTSSG